MLEPIEDRILSTVATCSRDEARRVIGEMLSHEFDVAFGNLLATATHRIRKTTRPQHVVLLTPGVRTVLEALDGKWFTSKDLEKLLINTGNMPAPFEPDPKKRIARLSQGLVAMYRAGHLEQRIVAGADTTVGKRTWVAAWAEPYSQTIYWRFSPQHEIETVSGSVPVKKV